MLELRDAPAQKYVTQLDVLVMGLEGEEPSAVSAALKVVINGTLVSLVKVKMAALAWVVVGCEMLDD